MGKASKFKKIRKLASQLPAMKDRAIIGERVKGVDLIERGIDKVQGMAVNPNIDYRQKKSVQAPLNHYKKMKQYFNQFGGAGVKGYVGAIIKHAKENNIPLNNAIPQ